MRQHGSKKGGYLAMSPTSTKQGKCYSFGEIEQALSAIEFFIDFRSDQADDDDDSPNEKHDSDNIYEDADADICFGVE